MVFVAPGTVLKEPILVAHLSAGNGAPTVSYLRTLVVAGPGSECRVVESFASPTGRPSLTNAVTEVVVEDNAFVDRYKLQQEGAGRRSTWRPSPRGWGGTRGSPTTRSRSGRRSPATTSTCGSTAEGGECVLNGLFVLDGRRVADTHSRIDHAKPHCSSRQLYKGIVDGQARGVFNGLVVVRPGRAEDRRRADEPEPPALAGGARALDPAARDPRRRRQVQARLDHRPARPGRPLLPPLARHRGGGGPEPADLGLRERPRPEDGGRAAAADGGAAPAGAPAVRAPASRTSRRRCRERSGETVAAFDVEAVRREFPILRETVHGKPLVYLDSAASAQKPQAVIDAERDVYERSYANIHRGVHHLSMVATDAYEKARGEGAALPGRRGEPGDRPPAGHDRGRQPRGAVVRAEARRRRATRC